MAEAAEPQETPVKKRSKKPIILGLLLAFLLGGAGFYATWSGMILGESAPVAEGAEVTPLPDIAFVPVDSLLISLGPGEADRHLRFTSQLEVSAPNAEEVTHLLPRIIDVMNGYLRAIDTTQFDDPAALVRMRAQMLRRVQIVTGEGRVRDLLVTEFVLN